MENIKLNLPPFYIGQKVVYLTGINLPKNSIHTVKDLRKFPCGCWKVDVGLKIEMKKTCCNKHGTGACIEQSNIGWFCSESFAPLEERFISMSEVIKKEMPLVGAN